MGQAGLVAAFADAGEVEGPALPVYSYARLKPASP